MTRITRAMNVPGRSLDQRREALERANVVRTARAKLKKDLASGKAGPRSPNRQPARVRSLRQGGRLARLASQDRTGQSPADPQPRTDCAYQDAGRPDQSPTRRTPQPHTALTRSEPPVAEGAGSTDGLGRRAHRLVRVDAFPEAQQPGHAARPCGVRKVGSRGEAVFVDEAAEALAALDGGCRWAQGSQLARRGIGRLEVERAVRPMPVVGR